MRQKVNIYLPPDLLVRYQAEAERDGISLSAYLVRRLSIMPDQIDELQRWLVDRLDRGQGSLETEIRKLHEVLAQRSDYGLLARVGLERLPRELLLGILRSVKQELEALTPNEREQLSAKGRELLARTNGAAK